MDDQAREHDKRYFLVTYSNHKAQTDNLISW